MNVYTQADADAPMLHGLITGMPESVYHVRPEISKHDADLCWKAPVLLRDKINLHADPTTAMIEGIILGAMLLGLSIDQHAVVLPDNAPRRPDSRQRDAKKPSEETVVAIKWWDRFNEGVCGRNVITEDKRREYGDIADAIKRSPEVSRLLAQPVASEVSMFWTCPVTGLQRRGRPDRLREGNIVIDLKKTACADVREFQAQVVKFRYDVQAAEYVDALRILTGKEWRFYWICYETEAPYLSACYEASETTLAIGRRRRDRALEKVKACIESGVWGGYQSGIPQIDPPKWLMIEEGI